MQLFAPFSVNDGSKIEKAEAANCVILTESFTSPKPLPDSTNTPKPEEVIYSVGTTGCVGKLARVNILAFPGPSVAFGSPELPVQRIAEDNFSFTFHTGEKTCERGDCNQIRIKLEILNDAGTSILTTSQSDESLAYECKTTGCTDPWLLKSTTGTELPAQTDCKITNVLFTPPTSTKPIRPDNATLYINTTGCQGQLLSELNIQASGTTNTTVLSIPRSTINSDNLSFALTTGETSCSGGDCDIIVDFYIRTSSTGQIITHYTSNKTDESDHFIFKCKGLGGDCDETSWSLGTATGTDQTAGSSSTTTVYYFDLTNTNGSVEHSANFPTEDSCKNVRDARAQNEESSGSGIVVSDCLSKTTMQTTAGTPTGSDQLPLCVFAHPIDGSFAGCMAQMFYYVFFVPTSYVFALAGTFLDFTFHYSVQDESYRTPFVVEGWGIVRDFCNMFFIFILLYIAFGTILNLHSVKTKEMIINVIIIGLLINFSLFTTQVIIDASNILARVFYNSDSIKITQNSTAGTAGLKIGPNGEIPLSAAIVNKVNPQNLIINGTKAVVIKDKVTNQTSTAEDTQGSLGVGAFILITLLATAVNIVGIIVFLSVGLIFVTRVIGLWFAMIFSPFVFFSYTVPSLQDMEMVGWKKWWPETLKLAFLAPIFIFFMYLIIAFLEKGLSLVKANDVNDGMTFVISVIVPFIFIMVLLMKAKDIAKDMSGKMGQSITNGLAAAGGIALGGAALGGALIGRKVIGGGLSALSKTDGATKRSNTKIQFNKDLEKWNSTPPNQRSGAKPDWKNYAAGAGIKSTTLNPFTALGSKLNVAQNKTNEVDRSRAHTDADIEKAGFKGFKWSELSGEQQKIVQDNVGKENYSKHLDDAERAYRNDPRNLAVDPKLNVVDSNTGKLKDLSLEQKKEVKDLAKSKAIDKFDDEINKASAGINAFTRVFSKANTGTWDLRKLSEASVDKRASVFTKIPVGLIAAVATGVRGGILKSSGLSHGTVKIEGDFLTDLKSTFKDAVKDMKIELPESHSGGDTKKVGHGNDGVHH